MEKVAYMLDSSADITVEEEKTLGYHVLRMPIIIENKEYIEGVNLSDNEMISALREGKKLKTSQPVLGEMITMWDELLKEYDKIFYIPLMKALSGTCASAINFAKEYNGKVVVLNSDFVCGPALVVMDIAKDLIENKGYSLQAAKDKIETECEMLAVLIPENLQALKDGGRISPAAAALAGMLKIVPLLKVDKDGIDVITKVRTLKKAYTTGIEYIVNGVDNYKDYYWMIIDIDNETGKNELKQELFDIVNQEVIERKFKAVIAAHTGAGTIGFGRIKKIK